MSRSFPCRRPAKPLRPLTLEHLESRELMAGQVFADRVQLVPDSSHAGQYVLTIQGTDQNDKIALSQKNDNLTVKFNGKSAGVYSAQSLSGVMVDGGLGNDTISLPAKSTIPSVLLGGSGNDTLTGGGGSNLLVGGDGNDKLKGGRGANVLMGGEGKDVLTGGAGDDQLFGDGDNDKLNGKGGRNMLLGGAGADKLAGKKTTNLLAEGNIDATDRAFEDWDVVNRFTYFLDESLTFLKSVLPDEVSYSAQGGVHAGPVQGSYDTRDGFGIGVGATRAGGAVGIPSRTVSSSISGNMMVGNVPMTGSISLSTDGSMQICAGPGFESKAFNFGASLQGCVSLSYSQPKPTQSIVHDDDAPRGSSTPAPRPSSSELLRTETEAAQWNQMVADVTNGLATQVPTPDPWTWNVPADTPLTLSDPSYWNYTPSTYINYDPSPWSSPLDPNFFGPYTDPFQFDPYYQGGYNDPFATDYGGYNYYDGSPYDSGTSYYDGSSYLPYTDYDYYYDYSGSYDTSYDNYSSGYSTGSSGGYSGGSGGSYSFDDNAPRYS